MMSWTRSFDIADTKFGVKHFWMTPPRCALIAESDKDIVSAVSVTVIPIAAMMLTSRSIREIRNGGTPITSFISSIWPLDISILAIIEWDDDKHLPSSTTGYWWPPSGMQYQCCCTEAYLSSAVQNIFGIHIFHPCYIYANNVSPCYCE